MRSALVITLNRIHWKPSLKCPLHSLEHLGAFRKSFFSFLPLSPLYFYSSAWFEISFHVGLKDLCLILSVTVKSNQSGRCGDVFLRETKELCRICWVGIPYKCILEHCTVHILILRGQTNDTIITQAFDSLVSERKISVNMLSNLQLIESDREIKEWAKMI